MEDKKNLSKIALIVSLVPVTALLPALFNIKVPNSINSIWAGLNIICIVLGFILSIMCVKNQKKRDLMGTVAIVISSIWLLVIVGVIALAILANI